MLSKNNFYYIAAWDIKIKKFVISLAKNGIPRQFWTILLFQDESNISLKKIREKQILIRTGISDNDLVSSTMLICHCPHWFNFNDLIGSELFKSQEMAVKRLACSSNHRVEQRPWGRQKVRRNFHGEVTFWA
jgi:hypothetical protein